MSSANRLRAPTARRLKPLLIRQSIRNAFDEWEIALNYKFKFEITNDLEEANIIFGWKPFEEEDNRIKAYTKKWGLMRYRVLFNDNGEQIWSANTEDYENLVSIEEVALHEIGHTLGLPHRCETRDYCRRCTQVDINLYNPVMGTHMNTQYIGIPTCRVPI